MLLYNWNMKSMTCCGECEIYDITQTAGMEARIQKKKESISNKINI